VLELIPEECKHQEKVAEKITQPVAKDLEYRAYEMR
jgi:hypothetical protein